MPINKAVSVLSGLCWVLMLLFCIGCIQWRHKPITVNTINSDAREALEDCAGIAFPVQAQMDKATKVSGKDASIFIRIILSEKDAIEFQHKLLAVGMVEERPDFVTISNPSVPWYTLDKSEVTMILSDANFTRFVFSKPKEGHVELFVNLTSMTRKFPKAVYDIFPE